MANTDTLKWYVAVLVMRARVGDTWADEDRLECQVRLLRASEAGAAYTRALALGAAEEHSYRNVDGALVRWEFAGLRDLDEVEATDLADGVEVYSWHSEGPLSSAVLPKEQLAVFWRTANGDRTANELLDLDRAVLSNEALQPTGATRIMVGRLVSCYCRQAGEPRGRLAARG